jgi:hypothetical protein
MDKATPLRARCHTHPDVTAVALCEVCGHALCLECAIPVRGETIGTECLAERIPDSSLAPPPPAASPRRPVPDRVALLALAVAVGASLLPWTRFGTGSGPLGAWGFSPARYASAVGPLAVAGLALVWAVSRPPRASERVRAVVAIASGTLVAACAVLALIRPVPFTRANPVPLLAVAAGLVAALAWPVWGRMRPDRSKTPLA